MYPAVPTTVPTPVSGDAEVIVAQACVLAVGGFVDGLGETEVENLYAAFAGDEDVVGLQVAVSDVSARALQPGREQSGRRNR